MPSSHVSYHQHILCGAHVGMIGPHALLNHHPTPLRFCVCPRSAASMRNTYSIICSEFASRGFVVAAVEHADGTACCTEVREASAILCWLCLPS